MKTKKLIAPIVISLVVCIYYITFAVICVTTPMRFVFKLLGFIIPLGLVGVCIFVLVERIKEIRSGEEDDLSKY